MLSLATALAVRAEINIGSLQVGTETYRDVIVTGKTADSIFITHSRGFTNIKVADIGPELLTKLGYDSKAVVKLKSGRSFAWEDLPIDPRLMAIKDQFATRVQAHLEGREKDILLTAWCVLLVAYLFLSYCGLLICQKSGGRPGIAAWIPVLQFLPLLQAAGMSVVWFFLALSPLVTPFLMLPVLKGLGPDYWWVLLLPFTLSAMTYLVWSVKICRARGVGSWVPLLLILPWTNLIAFLYLAFSSTGVKLRTAKTSARVRHFGNAQDTAFFLQS
jgi:hypothetical protein